MPNITENREIKRRNIILQCSFCPLIITFTYFLKKGTVLLIHVVCEFFSYYPKRAIDKIIFAK